MNDPITVIFMGTPDFAVPCLKSLTECNCVVDRVITQPDRPRGRGRRVAPPPVKQTAEMLGYPVLQPEDVGSSDFYDMLAGLQPDLFVVVAFGHILQKRILDIPRYGSLNIHASLLPAYRGPAPIQWAIINGERETGVTSMMMDKGLDTGEILLSEKLPILPEDTAGTLHDKLSVLAAGVLKKTINGIASGTVRPVSQNHAKASYAPMLKKTDGRIEWSKSAEEIERFIRGMNPWPGAYTFMGKKRFKIFRATVCPLTEIQPPGTVIAGFDAELRVACGKDALCIQEIQADSARRMEIGQFLKGQHIPLQSVFR
ncbi:MAG: methionyl-tRNA formyltransferase [Desulfosalsimonadaceae bacterium]